MPCPAHQPAQWRAAAARVGRLVPASVLVLALALAARAPAQTTSGAGGRAIQDTCNERVRKEPGTDFQACVAAESARQRERLLACARQIQLQGVRSTEQAAFLQRCLSAEDFAGFRAAEERKADEAGKPIGRAVAVAPASVEQWTHFDGPVTLRSVRVIGAKWSGAVDGERPLGEGELEVLIQHNTAILMDRPAVETVRLQGRMRDGQLHGPVRLLQHPSLASSKDAARENEFLAGRSIGLLPTPAAQCPQVPPLQAGATGATFYGTCREGAPYAGLVVFDYRGQPHDLACLARGQLRERSELAAFEPCASQWRLLPRHCAAGDYQGQCRDGRPDGVGVQLRTRSAGMMQRSYDLRRGNFADGELSGFGYAGKAENCGPAGCSGDRGEELGWFQRGQFRWACASVAECLPNVSGADYIRALGQGLLADAAVHGDTPAFREAIGAFRRNGERQALREAAQQARSGADRAALEHELMRIAGYDKVFTARAEVSAPGQQRIGFDERDRLLGFFRSTDSQVPLRVDWRIRNDADAVRIHHGSYAVTARVGVRVRMKRTTCLGSICNEQSYSDVFERQVAVTMRPGQAEASGQFDLRQTMNSASVMFGMASASTLDDVEPYLVLTAVNPTP